MRVLERAGGHVNSQPQGVAVESNRCCSQCVFTVDHSHHALTWRGSLFRRERYCPRRV